MNFSLSSFRKGAISLAAASSIMAFSSAAAQAFTLEQCKSIVLTSTYIVKNVGRDKLSSEFIQSLTKFFMPDGKTLTCSGPKQIAWRI